MQPTYPEEPQGQPPYGQQPGQPGGPAGGQPGGPPPGGPGGGQPGGPGGGYPGGPGGPPPGGQPTPGGGYPGQPSNGLGVTALILGIAAIPLVCCFYIGVPLGIVAVVLGWLGKQKAERGEATNRGQAMAGLICGAVAVVLGILLLLAVVVFNVVDWDVPTH